MKENEPSRDNKDKTSTGIKLLMNGHQLYLQGNIT